MLLMSDAGDIFGEWEEVVIDYNQTLKYAKSCKTERRVINHHISSVVLFYDLVVAPNSQLSDQRACQY